jgi:NTE family protein
MSNINEDALEKPIGFVLAGGASLGAVQVGMLEVIANENIKPDFIVGTSVGAVNGALMASDYSLERVNQLRKTWCGLETEDIFPGINWWNLGRFLMSSSLPYLSSNEGLQHLIETNLPEDPDSLTIPFSAIATDLLSGQRVVLEDGNLHRNVLASAAIPGIFPSVKRKDQFLVDGGVVAQVPLHTAQQKQANTLIVFDPGYPCALSELPDSKIGYALQIMTLMSRQQTIALMETISDETTILYLPAPCPSDVPPHDFSQTDSLIQQGHELTEQFLEEITLDGPDTYGHPHIHR